MIGNYVLVNQQVKLYYHHLKKHIMDDLKLQIEDNILNLTDQIMNIHYRDDLRERCINNVKLIHDAFYNGRGMRKINMHFIPSILRFLKLICLKSDKDLMSIRSLDTITDKCIELAKNLSNLISRYIIANDAEKTRILNLELELERLRNENYRISQRMIMDAAEVSPNQVIKVEPSAPPLKETI